MTFFPRKHCAAIATAAALATALTAGAPRADEAALYDAPAPEDAVFVRVLAEYDAAGAPVPFADTTLPMQDAEPDTYVAVSASALTGLTNVTAGSFYSVSAAKDGPMTIKEPPRETAAKVHLILVNTGDQAVRLVVPGQDMEVVAALAPGKSASRAVNPISVALVVERVSDGAILGAFDMTLTRGQNLSFVAGKTSARVIQNSFGPILTLN